MNKAIAQIEQSYDSREYSRNNTNRYVRSTRIILLIIDNIFDNVYTKIANNFGPIFCTYEIFKKHHQNFRNVY